MSKKPAPTPASELPYEQAIEELESIVDQIESGEIGLEDSLKQYERGTQLIARCQAVLDGARKKIQELAVDDEGNLQETPSEDADESDE